VFSEEDACTNVVLLTPPLQRSRTRSAYPSKLPCAGLWFRPRREVGPEVVAGTVLWHVSGFACDVFTGIPKLSQIVSESRPDADPPRPARRGVEGTCRCAAAILGSFRVRVMKAQERPLRCVRPMGPSSHTIGVPQTGATISVENVVASASVDQRFDLDLISKHFLDVEYRPRVSPGWSSG